MSSPTPLLARFADFQLDEANARLLRGGQPIELPPKAFELLCALARRPDQLVLKDELLDAVWGHRHVSESVLKTTISQLRGALADDAKQPRFIETASRRGYRFIAALGAGAPAVAPRPAEPAFVAAPGLVGRQGALGRLHTAFAAARQGRRQLVLVAGEPGIGKSTLIDRFVSEVAETRPAHALGQCVEHYGAGEAYMPVLEALNLLCRGEAGAWLVALMRRVAPSWLAQLPWYLEDEDRRQLQREVAGATQDRMLREFGELVDRAAAERPVLLVLEDLHWSDHATLQLIGYLARRRSPAALMLVGSFRPAEVIADDHPLAGLRQELRLHRLCEELDLESFSEAEVDKLVASRLDGEKAPEDFVRALHAHTEGLPLFVVNVLDELMADGALHRADGRWAFPEVADFGVPHSVVGVVEKQIARLSAELQRLLGAASVAGTEFNHAVLAAVLQMPADDLQATLDAAATRGPWLRSAGVVTLPNGQLAARYAFRHALYRHVHYQRQAEAQRVQWHRQAAAALAAAHGPRASEVAAELAMHFERGGEWLPAAMWQGVVGGRAMGRSAPQEALRAARHALRLLGDQAPPELELDLRVLEGVALTRQHVISEPVVAAVYERAHRLSERVSDSPARARAMQGLWWVSFGRGELVAARTLAERIHALGAATGDVGLRLAGDNAMGMTLAMTGDLTASRRHLAQSVALYREAGRHLPPGLFVQDPGVEAMSYLGLVSWWCGEPALARQMTADAVALAREIRHPISELIALNLAAVMHQSAGEREQALMLLDELFAVIERHDLPRGPGSFGWLRGGVLAVMGRVDEGMALIRAGERSVQTTGMRIGLTGFYLQLAEACRAGGRHDEAAAAIEDALAWAEQSGERTLLSLLYRQQAEHRHARGDLAGAAASLRQAIDTAAAQGARLHELMALAAARGLPGLGPPQAAERAREIAAGLGDDPSPVLALALRQLAG